MAWRMAESQFDLRVQVDKVAPHRSESMNGTLVTEERQATAGGRDLVALADGTGNSAAKSFKSNVWRIYQALDLTDGTQLAVFGDGVGTSSFKPMQYLGLALGLGVKRNVLNLYKFWCLNYNAGDRLWAFGFSRGAFTVRLLADLVHYEGLVSFASEEELDRAAIAAYRAYRSKTFPTKIPWVWAARAVRDIGVRLRNWATGARQYSEIKAETYSRGRHLVDIHFIGVWDTVAAYGLPIHELTLAFNRWVWPMLFTDTSLPPNVLRARQALSLDDERRTFFPIPWDEAEERKLREQDDPSLDPDRLVQVWFAGTHANIGGGYPDDSLAYVPLLWMIDEAASNELRFNPLIVANYAAIASPTGRLYDSRAGFGVFYRYQPRNVQALMGRGVRPLVHYEVITRMAQGSDGYAPISLPHDFDVLPPFGLPLKFDRPGEVGVSANMTNSRADNKKLQGPTECVHQKTEAYRRNAEMLLSRSINVGDRENLVKLTQDTVWWRRLLYFVSLGLALMVAAYPLIYDYLNRNEITGLVNLTAGGFVEVVAGLAGGFLPGIAAPWLTAIARNPAVAICIVAALFFSLWLSRFLQRRIRDRARAAWGVRTILDGIQLGHMRLTEQRQAALTAAIIFAVLLVLALMLHSKASFLVALGLGLLSSAIFWVGRARHESKSNNAERPSFLLAVARKVRLNKSAGRCYSFIEQKAFPFAVLLLCVCLFFSVGYRALLDGASATGNLCQASEGPKVTDDGLPREKLGTGAEFFTRSMCHATGLFLVKGRRYRVTLTMKDHWFDKTVETDVGGFPSDWRLLIAVPLRRWLTSNWFEPIARIGAAGDYEYPLDPQSPIPEVSFQKCEMGAGPTLSSMAQWLRHLPDPISDAQKSSQIDCDERNGIRITQVLISDIRPKASGELYIYVNDAVLLWPGSTDLFYRNNSGSATVRVERIEADAIIGETIGVPKLLE